MSNGMLVTSHWGRVKDLSRDNYLIVSIVRKQPLGFAGDIGIPHLAPNKREEKLKGAEFNREYIRKLNTVDVKQSMSIMYRIMLERKKTGVALVGYPENWDECHRKLLAEHYNKHTQKPIKEYV